MTQLGILFDAQKLGSGFYGYTAFRILFTVAPPRDLADCTLYHGEVGDGRDRPYCIAIESENPAVLNRVRQAFASSMARGLMPHGQRFFEGLALQEEVLALAARITGTGHIADCTSRWLQEAWQRATNQASLAIPSSEEELPIVTKAMEPPKPKTERVAPVRLPDGVPLALRTSTAVRRTVGWLAGFSIGGLVVPWFGWGLAACAMICTAGVIQVLVLRWRLWAECELAGKEVLNEALKLLGTKPLQEVAEKLGAQGRDSSPLLRRLAASARVADAGAASLIAREHSNADSEEVRADSAEVNLYAVATLMAAALSLAVWWVSKGPSAAWLEAPRLTTAGLTGGSLLWILGSLLQVRSQRLNAEITRLTAKRWLPALTRNATPTPSQKIVPPEGGEKGLHDLAVEIQSLRVAMETASGKDRTRDAEISAALGELRASINQLTPVLAGFREPFVLQAVPARPKPMSATA